MCCQPSHTMLKCSVPRPIEVCKVHPGGGGCWGLVDFDVAIRAKNRA